MPTRGDLAAVFLAFAHGKVGRWDVDEHAALTLESEDALTAMVLGRLRYVPLPLAWELLVGAADLVCGERPALPGAIEVQFWPRWELLGRVVEPDVVWAADASVLVVEVKWTARQEVEQLAREHAAGQSRYSGRSITVLALGGLRAELAASLEASVIQNALTLSWQRLAARARELRDGLAAGPTRTVLDDVLEVLRWRGLKGLRDLSWLSTLPDWTVARELSWSPVGGGRRGRTLTDLALLPALTMTTMDWRPT